MIPDSIKRLNSHRGYFDEFYKELANNPGITHKEAYLRIEDRYEAWYGCNRYTSYDSFRAGKYKYFDLLARKAIKKRSATV